jgi:hypothetical protein
VIAARADRKIARVLKALRDAEEEMGDELLAVAERHAAEHEIHHGARTLARQCASRATRVAELGAPYGAELDPVDAEADPWQRLMAGMRREMSEALGRQRASGLLLLRDLRRLHLKAMEVDFYWILTGQVAQAVRDHDLLAGCLEMHEDATTAAKWILTQVKVLSPAILTVPD